MKPETLYWDNKSLLTLDGEEWVDVYGYDGMYSVSNLGRIKSEQREVNTRWGTPRMKPEKILSQHIIKNKMGRPVALTVSLYDKSYCCSRLFYKSFNPEVDFEDFYECAMHINKNVLDNRIVNLQKVTRKTSKGTDMVKSKWTLKATHENIKLATEINREFYGNRTHRTCVECGTTDLIERFSVGRNICKPCINAYQVGRRNDYEYTNKPKRCGMCGETKMDTEFNKNNNRCKKCCNDVHNDYVWKQKKELGDWFIKNYGKTNYGIIEFDEGTMQRLRSEITEKRKPKYFLDGLGFHTIKGANGLAEYINKKYKIPVATVVGRIRDGRSEGECTLTRREFTALNKR